jgi:hypothetical protein
MGIYEVQVLDSCNNITYADGQAAAVYGQYPPLVSASRPPGEWQSYDIVWHRPHFDAQGRLASAADHGVLQRPAGAGQRDPHRPDGTPTPPAISRASRRAAAESSGPRQSGAVPERLD